jgi:DNA-binding transcriptional regulator YhcF (GntR family)
MGRRDDPASRVAEASSAAPPSEQALQEQTPAQIELEDLTIDRAGEIPIGVQLAWALRARIGDGRLAPGQRLPGLRELAEMLGINANTARTVYQRLEQEGLIDSRQGTGTFVASVAQEPSAVGQIAADAARQARKTGVDPREVAAALYVSAEPPADTAANATDTAEAGERRRELRAQIAALEQTLSEIQAAHPGLIPVPSKPLRQAGPRLLSVTELERVRMELVRRLAAAEPLLKASTDAEQRTVDAQRSAAHNLNNQVEDPRTTGELAATVKRAKPAPERTPPRARPRTRPSTA